MKGEDESVFGSPNDDGKVDTLKENADHSGGNIDGVVDRGDGNKGKNRDDDVSDKDESLPGTCFILCHISC